MGMIETVWRSKLELNARQSFYFTCNVIDMCSVICLYFSIIRITRSRQCLVYCEASPVSVRVLSYPSLYCTVTCDWTITYHNLINSISLSSSISILCDISELSRSDTGLVHCWYTLYILHSQCMYTVA